MLLLAGVLCGPSLLVADEVTRAVQEELRHRHIFYGNIDGQESPELTRALKQYQERKGFRQTGVADVKTLRSMSITPERGADLPDVPVLRSDHAAPPNAQGAQDGISSLAPAGSWNGGVVPTIEEIRTYLRDYLSASQAASATEELAFYAPQLAYYDQGVVTKTYVRNEIVAYRQHWPDRQYVLDENIVVTPRADKVSVRYRVGFTLANAALNRKAAGATNNILLLTRGSDERWEIAAIQEERVRPTGRRHSSHRRSRDPVGRTMRNVGRSVRKIFR